MQPDFGMPDFQHRLVPVADIDVDVGLFRCWCALPRHRRHQHISGSRTVSGLVDADEHVVGADASFTAASAADRVLSVPAATEKSLWASSFRQYGNERHWSKPVQSWCMRHHGGSLYDVAATEVGMDPSQCCAL